MTSVHCACGEVHAELHAAPVAQFYCHCDDCQAVSGLSYVGVALYPAEAVRVTQGELVTFVHRTMPRERCGTCGTPLFGRPPGQPIIGVNAGLLPAFAPTFHIRCRYALRPVVDALPHYRNVPAELGGTGEVMDW